MVHLPSCNRSRPQRLCNKRAQRENYERKTGEQGQSHTFGARQAYCSSVCCSTTCQGYYPDRFGCRGRSDYYSDLDIILYYDKLPADEELLAAFQRNEGQDYRLLGQADEEKIESYLVDGVECQCAHTTIAAWERDMAVVLEQLDVTTPLQKALSGMLEALPLYGESLVRQWQAKLVAYPETLARAMVEHYLPVYPLWGLQERLAGRDATIWVYEMLVEIAQHLLGVLAGLNRRYYSTFQFKRMHRFVAQLDIAPPDFADRLESLFHADVASAAEQARALTRETVALVDEHMPQVDTSRARARIDFQQQAWKL